MNTEEIMKEFDEKLKMFGTDWSYKPFIRQALASARDEERKLCNSGRKMYELGKKEERERLRGEVKGMLFAPDEHKTKIGTACHAQHNQAIHHVLALLFDKPTKK